MVTTHALFISFAEIIGVVPIRPNPYDLRSSTMLPELSQTLRSPQFSPHNLQVSRDHDVFNSNCYDSMLFDLLHLQGEVDQHSVIPHIDNMEQENLVPRNIGKSTRSQMKNQTARLNASNPSPDCSLQSQNRGLNTQQVRSITKLS
ncbi:hypothetical protein SADUNF_Sadunf19G0004400 [Salix dunnii]|uniref:Uncharacterized protein n=1 Tax=Salix dunnii TaxID=1413687 RepID=A0A835MC27_9ROSI|nr:hypothetical protein SADUNF_Sadunf19G0004400 [Salix dunnii]